MKYTVTLHCNIEGLFYTLTDSVIQSYKEAKKMMPTQEQLSHGLSFQAQIKLSRKSSATTNVKVHKYIFPTDFKMEYKSATYHKITSFHLNEIDEDHTEMIYENFNEKMVAGIGTDPKGTVDSTEIEKAPALEAMRFRATADAVRRGQYGVNPWEKYEKEQEKKAEEKAMYVTEQKPSKK